MSISVVAMEPSWLQAIPANVQRGQNGRPLSSRRLSSCKSLNLKSSDMEKRGSASVRLAAVGTALETPVLAPKLLHSLGMLPGAEGSFFGELASSSTAVTVAMTSLLSRKTEKSRRSYSAVRSKGKALAAGLQNGSFLCKDSMQGILGSPLDTSIFADVRRGESRTQAASGGNVLASVSNGAASSKFRVSGLADQAEEADRSSSSVLPLETTAISELQPLNQQRSLVGSGPLADLRTSVDSQAVGGSGQGASQGRSSGGRYLREDVARPPRPQTVGHHEIGPWAVGSASIATGQEDLFTTTTSRSDDNDDDDTDDIDAGSDSSSSTTDDEAAERNAELASFSGRGIPILDPSTGCSDLPFREFMPLSRLQIGTKGGASIGALQKPAGQAGVWLVASKHAGCAPTLAFTLTDACELLWSVKPSPLVKIVPAGNNSVKAAFKDAGCRRVPAESRQWDMLWSGKALKVDDFKGLNKNQKVNHFPGTWELGRKDHLYKHLAAARRRHPLHYDFLPGVFLLPEDHAEWVEDSRRDPEQLYILKPRSSSRGRGVRLLRKPADLPKLRPSLVQKYVSNPHLIHGYKYDLRLYVVVTSWDPLRVYIYREGLVRFASEKYGLDRANLKKRCAHITNTSVNNKGANREEGATVAAKWSLSALEAYLEGEGLSFGAIWEDIRGVMLKTLIAVEGRVNALCQAHVPHRGNCFELYGFDVLLDTALKPWLLEVNTGPALHCPTALDREIKFKLIRDMLHLVGFTPYDREALAREEEEARRVRLLGLEGRPKRGGREEEGGRLVRREWQSLDDDTFVAATSRRLPLLIQEGESENARRSDFERLYPTSDAESFAPLFETQRFNNTLYTRWLRLQKEAPATQAARGRRSTSRLSQMLRPEDSRQASAGGDSTLSTSSNGSSRSRSMELTMEKVRR